ncbi:aspartate aminotransferase family protein [Nocardia camponoti]|uniref:Aspartate aminotransferase family protein n=1 Tax=Nocardia camponoti TaxID=1616106 RepID=A0A917QQ71_9NOCA|nr:aspartate aminotransferase family protein [Nocardia camponoti]GGK63248.1 aspartate aminotransferase family protein [Nocardia camponoti]
MTSQIEGSVDTSTLDTNNANTAQMNEQRLLELGDKYSFRGRIDRKVGVGPIFVRGRGTEVVDMQDKTYLDFNSGQMCAALGHNHPRIVQAIHEACETLIHGHSSFYNVKEVELATRIAELLPDPLSKTLFGESGADANEFAMSVARLYTGGRDIYAPLTSFHGVSVGTRSVTFAGWRRGHGGLPSDGKAMFAPYCYRCPLSKTFPSCKLACLDASFELIDGQSAEQPAAVITEPLFSAGGVIDPPPGWLRRLAELCAARDMLLIVDEEQTGLGKLGSMFGFEDEGVVPDIVTLAKHFGGGVGVSAMTTSPIIEEVVVEAGMTVTHSHSNDPLICAAGIASLDIVAEENVPEVARALGERMLQHLHELAERYELIGDIRGRGQLTGVELVTNRDTREPANEAGKALGDACLKAGLIFSVRRDGSVIRFVPPSSTTLDQIDQAMEIFARELEVVSGATRSE